MFASRLLTMGGKGGQKLHSETRYFRNLWN